MKIYSFTAQIEKEGELYIGSIVGVPGAHTQAWSLDELQINLKEVLDLVMEEKTIR